MQTFGLILLISQFMFTIVAITYFLSSLKSQHSSKVAIKPTCIKESEKLIKMRSIRLTEPLAEKARPTTLSEIVGQENAIKALRAAICTSNPQHIIIYGPAGVGKTTAARIILEEAKKLSISPFKKDAKFIEIDATTLRFDERSITDPLLGSVHDPIYQGAGSFGSAGIPQPKPGAVTMAHGGVLFLDEIGELHQAQLNKLLKVLEDRKVFLTSSYYNSEDKSLPKYIHDVFQNGFPADFRLIGATTRSPEELPTALRSRCCEIFFNSLKDNEIIEITVGACRKLGYEYDLNIPSIVSNYCANGRTAINIIQSSAAFAAIEGRKFIKTSDVLDVIEASRFHPKISKKISGENFIGIVNGLAVNGASSGMLLEIETSAEKSKTGSLTITGIANEEDIKKGGGSIKRKSTSLGSIENALTVLSNTFKISHKEYDLHINFPGGMPVDGPSAGIAVFCVLLSAMYSLPISSYIAMTGELSIKGSVLPVGGVRDKIEAAILAGASTVIIPHENMQDNFNDLNIKIIPVKNIDEVIKEVFGEILITSEQNIKYVSA